MSVALITGIEGFTGPYLAAELISRGYTVMGIGVTDCPEWFSAQQYARIDLLDAEGVKHVIARLRPDLVFHLAGMSHVMCSSDLLYRVNVVASRNLVAALAALETPPSFTLLASSANLYGNAGGVLYESTPPDPRNDYAVSKLAMEYMARIWTDRLPLTIVRPFNYTGRGQAETFLIPKLVKHFKERLPILELGNTHVEREFGDVRDVAGIYASLAEKRAQWGPFNICSGVGHTLNSILDELRAMTGHQPEIRINPAFERSNEVHTLIGDPTRLIAILGDLQLHTLTETLQWMLEN